MNCSRRRGKIPSATSSFYYGFFFRGSFGWGGFFLLCFCFRGWSRYGARVKMIAVLLRRSLLSLLFLGFNFCSWHSFLSCFPILYTI